MKENENEEEKERKRRRAQYCSDMAVQRIKNFWRRTYNKILLGLIAGAIFGTVFNQDPHKLKIITEETRKVVEGWERAEAILEGSKIEFSERDGAIKIIKFFQNLPKPKKEKLVIIFHKPGKEKEIFERIVNIQKVETLATAVKPIGTIFVRLLIFIAIPLVIASLISGMASFEDTKTFGKIATKTIAYYIATTLIAITIGLICVNLIKPGLKIPADIKDKIISEYRVETKEIKETKGTKEIKEEGIGFDLIGFITNIVPTNPINAAASGNMLQIIFFSVVFGLALTKIDKSKSEVIIKFFDGMSEATIKIVNVIMKIAPYGVFALISATVAEFGPGILYSLIFYITTVLFCLAIHLFVIYSIFVRILGGENPVKFFRGIKDAQLIALSTSSSAATLPVNIECLERNLGVPKKIVSFVLPLGATLNMDGTALYQAVAAGFIAQTYGVEIGLAQQLTIVLIATLASVGTAPVPGAGIIMLAVILKSIGVPEEGIALILGVDRLLDMFRTVVNVTGDGTAALFISRGIKKKKPGL